MQLLWECFWQPDLAPPWPSHFGPTCVIRILFLQLADSPTAPRSGRRGMPGRSRAARIASRTRCGMPCRIRSRTRRANGAGNIQVVSRLSAQRSASHRRTHCAPGQRPRGTHCRRPVTRRGSADSLVGCALSKFKRLLLLGDNVQLTCTVRQTPSQKVRGCIHQPSSALWS